MRTLRRRLSGPLAEARMSFALDAATPWFAWQVGDVDCEALAAAIEVAREAPSPEGVPRIRSCSCVRLWFLPLLGQVYGRLALLVLLAGAIPIHLSGALGSK